MKKTHMAKAIRNLALCFSVGSTLIACGGSASTGASGKSATLLADGETCAAAWNSTTAYNGGVKVSRSGRNYTSAFWTQNQDPANTANSGAAGSGKPWITGYLCGGGTSPTPTPTPAPTPTPTPAPTPTPTSSCSYQTWSAGVNYPVGTIVKYPANGQFYKEVNAGTNGSDGTDPTISTWYWQPTTCASSSPTPTPTPTPSSGWVVSETQFNQMFPSRNSFYTYSGLRTAMSYYSAFATTGTDTIKKQESAAFLANVAHESDLLKAVREYNTANYGSYCDYSKSYGCPAGQAAYYGRGPIQLSWNFNYKTAGDSMGVNLLNSPDLVATDAAISWRTGLWYWMNGTGNAGTTPHNIMINSQGFGMTIQAINGSLECGGKRPAEVQRRVDFYTQFTQILGVPTGSNLYC